MDCFCEESWRNHTPHSTAQDRVLPAVSDRVKWPAHMGARPPPYFNAGMFVFKPDLATYHDLLSTLKAIPPTPFAEQSKASGLENAGGTGTGPPARPPLPPVYNLVMSMLWRHPEKIDLGQVKVVHYCATGAKPWRFSGKEENMDREDVRMLASGRALSAGCFAASLVALPNIA
ncbi:hypothetical protein CRG98_003467 [Punica granatum]|uniref:Hexosyltransferase n=1 Tax=Punica granatum TaxID=22663 RepID=A0A2I0L7L4_PUNGR|nr:hypothetical protein CRG98_003467 [Punica granatum]